MLILIITLSYQIAIEKKKKYNIFFILARKFKIKELRGHKVVLVKSHQFLNSPSV